MQRFSKRGVLEETLGKIRTRKLEDDGQFILPVVGDVNTGKTALSLLLDHYFNEGDVDLGTYALSHESFMSAYTTEPKGKTIVFEEGRTSFDINKYSHTETVEARDALRDYRKLNHTVLINFQDASDMSMALACKLADGMIRTPSKGIAHIYARQTTRSMFDRGRKEFKGWKEADARDFFPDPAGYVPELWSRYEDKALERLRKKSDYTDDDEDADGSEADGELSGLMSTGTVADLFDVSGQTVRNWLKQGDYDVVRLEDSNQIRFPESVVNELKEDKLKA